MAPDWSALAALVHAHQTFTLTSHVRPDCDALGSELGMAAVLRTLGKDVVISNGQETPPNLAFIDPERQIRVLGTDITAAEIDRRDVLMVLDTSAWQQLGPMAAVVRATPAKRVVVDHHVSQDDLQAQLFKDTSAEATGRLVLDFARHLGVKLTPEIVSPLFAAVATDTGWFRFGSASSITFRAAAEMIDAGARPSAIYRELYEQDTLGRVRLRGLILAHVRTELDGRLAHTYVLREDFAETGALPSDTEDAINMALAIAGTQVAVILVEQPQGGFKISFRSRCDVDCSRLAEQFGGGGHKAAAGASVAGDFAAAQPLVLDAVRAAMR
jgi:phosphoesterase RecJ-like protein